MFFAFLSVCLSACLSICLSASLFFCLFGLLSVRLCLPVCRSFYLFVCVPACLCFSGCLSVCRSVCLFQRPFNNKYIQCHNNRKTTDTNKTTHAFFQKTTKLQFFKIQQKSKNYWIKKLYYRKLLRILFYVE